MLLSTRLSGSRTVQPSVIAVLLMFGGVLTGCSSSESTESRYRSFDELEAAVIEPALAPDSNTSQPDTSADTAADEVSPLDLSADESTSTATPSPATAPISPVGPDEPAPEEMEDAAGADTVSVTEPLRTPPAVAALPAEMDGDAAKDDQPVRAIELLIPHRQFRKEGRSLRVSFDDIDLLKVLNMEPVPLDAADHFPDWLTELHGKQVRIRGYMRPGFEDEDIEEFLFVRDNGECCYGPLPKIYDMIAVELADGQTTDLIEGTPFDVQGEFRIEPHVDEVELYGLFFIRNGVIIE